MRADIGMFVIPSLYVTLQAVRGRLRSTTTPVDTSGEKKSSSEHRGAGHDGQGAAFSRRLRLTTSEAVEDMRDVGRAYSGITVGGGAQPAR
jgi:hypothetical protein